MARTRLAGLRVAVTGGARGIGLATAKELTRRGATVVIGDLDETLAINAATQLDGEALGVALDVSSSASFEQFLKTAAADGPLDVLVNNAGIMPIGPFLEQPPEIMRRAMEVNVVGCLNGMSLALPGMLERGRGHIVNVASTAGKTPVPGGVVYCGSKSAVVAITETARVEFAGTGVQFTCAMPHFTNTELIVGTTATKLIPIVQPEDVARAIVDAIEHRRKDVFVPKVVGSTLRVQTLLGRRIRDLVSRRLGAYDTFLHFDSAKRSTYDKRITNS